MVRVYPSSYLPVLAGTKEERARTRALVVKGARKAGITEVIVAEMPKADKRGGPLTRFLSNGVRTGVRPVA